MHGVLGAAAVKHVEVEFSRDRESVKGHSSVVKPALEKRGSRSAAMKRDALVSDPETVKKKKKCFYKTIKRLFTPVFVPIFLEPHEICAEQNTGEAVWRKTPAGDEAAVACPADASGTITVDTSFVFWGFFSLWMSPAVCFHYAINK